MMLTKVDNWTTAKGRYAEARLDGKLLCAGIVGAVTEDGATLWMQPFIGVRRVFHREDSYEIWARNTPSMGA